MNSFEFTPENRARFEEIVARYPQRRAAMLPALHLCHEQLGYISPGAEEYVAGLLEVPLVDVREVLTFYTLYFRRPMGRHHVRLCMSISCWIRRAEEIRSHLRDRMGVESGETTSDGEFSWEAVPDCLGACELAPMMQVDKDYYGFLDAGRVDGVLEAVRQGEAFPNPRGDGKI